MSVETGMRSADSRWVLVGVRTEALVERTIGLLGRQSFKKNYSACISMCIKNSNLPLYKLRTWCNRRLVRTSILDIPVNSGAGTPVPGTSYQHTQHTRTFRCTHSVELFIISVKNVKERLDCIKYQKCTVRSPNKNGVYHVCRHL